jgi:ABC-type Mn2+/Zn2+ transport system ATPase subunit
VPVGRRRRRLAAECLTQVGLAEIAEQPFWALSGGQKQRVLIARALAVRPNVLVLDEPTTGMDVRAEAELLAMVRRIRAERDLAVVLVTHSLHLVADETTEVGILQDGRAVFGRPDEVLAPEVLTRIYGCRVESATAGGHRVIRAVPDTAGVRADGATP